MVETLEECETMRVRRVECTRDDSNLLPATRSLSNRQVSNAQNHAPDQRIPTGNPRAEGGNF